MSVKLLIEHHLEFLSLKEAAHALLSLYLSKFHVVGNHVSGLISFICLLYLFSAVHCYVAISSFSSVQARYFTSG